MTIRHCIAYGMDNALSHLYPVTVMMLNIIRCTMSYLLLVVKAGRQAGITVAGWITAG